MLDTMRKDLILNRRALWINALLFSAFFVFMSSWEEGASGGYYTFFASLMVAFMPVVVVTREDKFKAMALGCSLPVTRRTIVRARYALAMSLIVVGLLFALTLGSVFPTSSLTAAELFRPATLLTALAVAVLITSVLLPFSLRFGAFGLILVLVAFQVVGIVLVTLVRLTGGPSDRRWREAVIQAVSDLHDQIGTVGFDTLVLLGLALVLLASYAVSVRVFERRDL